MIQTRTLSFKLLTGGIAAIAIPVLIVGFFSIKIASKGIKDIAREKAQIHAQSIALHIDAMLNQEVILANTLSGDDDVIDTIIEIDKTGQTNETSELYHKLKSQFKWLKNKYQGMFITDARGSLITGILDSGKEYKESDISDREYFKIVKNEKKTYISNVVRSKTTDKFIIVICVPVMNESGNFAGTLGMSLKLEYLTDIINNTKVGTTGYGYMADEKGIIIAHQNKEYIMQLDIKTLEGMKEITRMMLGGQTGVQDYKFMGKNKIAGFAPLTIKKWSISVTQDEKEFLQSANSLIKFIIITGIISLTIIIAILLKFSRSISTPINKSVQLLNFTSEELTSAAVQVSASSHDIASAVSQQAAATEEASAALEQTSAMVRQNAQISDEADRMMKEIKEIAENADLSMKELSASMTSIYKTGEDTRKIVKSIDEIAFQTNLLSLNAAIEAARVGNHGAGFAVVAQEVRNLAKLSADSVNNTSILIEESVKKISAGKILSETTAEAFAEAVKKLIKVSELIGEISASSTEQAQGIDEIRNSVTQVDEMTQNNAASAEESASIAQTMNTYAEDMKKAVAGLSEIVEGRR
ncbi:Methyl-accepting chemotaxis protein signailling domain-containing protein, double Cache domain-containing protein [Desulfonema limicola]|uniref:Methyl-accepting chemotaxis protein signailling domain-containing protein, double Cache domain-containing protein n=1 Tax=Desulfonema limicola TaxID=45656 RepID=A0A975GIE9_9BACT|nr:methyl-accepting chemotaxis protein [Desulfonema limicola]QTA82512.1 Methyl-accepting chemotaxis protein signailling domain-containing protein, double Cache domain-containing protein [Desulfonema limicola]